MKFQEFFNFCGNNFNVSDHNATAEEMKHLSKMRILCAIDFKMSTCLFLFGNRIYYLFIYILYIILYTATYHPVYHILVSTTYN